MSVERDTEGADHLRIDRWLWCARFFKTRTAAAQAVRGGHVRINGRRPKPSRPVAIGDRITMCRDLDDCEVVVTAIPRRRGPAAEAAACYAEHEASVARRMLRAEQRRAASQLIRPPTSGRPDKRTRRLLRARREA